MPGPGLQTDNMGQEDGMRVERLKEVIRVLMGSRFYFNLTTRERYNRVIRVLNMMETR